MAMPALLRRSRRLGEPFGDPRAARESAELLQRLLASGLSRFDPDPLGGDC